MAPVLCECAAQLALSKPLSECVISFAFALDGVLSTLEVCFYKTHHPSISGIPALVEIG